MGSAVYPDRTTCFCCSVALVHWTKDHDPQREHEKRSPTCGFVTGYYQKFHNEQVRLESFSNWPLGADYCAVPDKLAKAGFYQQNTSQYSDRCVCFCCGIALVKWERGDDPWTEHAKYSTNCPSVRRMEVGNVAKEEALQELCEGRLKILVQKLHKVGIDTLDAPSYFLCPITPDIYMEPVVAEDGHTYERSAIQQWLSTRTTSPLTNKMLYSSRLIPNHNLNAQMIDYVEQLLAKHIETTD